jgi:tetratricopeptide (TPR) repeat protein
MLGRALRDTGDADGAITAFRKAMALNPNGACARDMARAQAPRGRLEEARVVWEKNLEDDPADYDPWYGYAQLCAFLGNEEAYRRARKALLKRFGDTTNDWVIAERTSLACLLLPASGEELRRAVVLADRAVAAGPKFACPDNAYLQFVKGLAEYRQGRPEQAVRLLQESAALLPNRASPRLALAVAQFKSGSTKEARKTLAVAVRTYNWKESQTDHTTAWVSHVLRRQAEALILRIPVTDCYFAAQRWSSRSFAIARKRDSISKSCKVPFMPTQIPCHSSSVTQSSCTVSTPKSTSSAGKLAMQTRILLASSSATGLLHRTHKSIMFRPPIENPRLVGLSLALSFCKARHGDRRVRWSTVS